jgi:hypothetical protein
MKLIQAEYEAQNQALLYDSQATIGQSIAIGHVPQSGKASLILDRTATGIDFCLPYREASEKTIANFPEQLCNTFKLCINKSTRPTGLRELREYAREC